MIKWSLSATGLGISTRTNFNVFGFLFLVCCYLVACPDPLSAASKSKKQKNNKSEVYYYESKAFDTTLSKLKPYFLGHNYRAAFSEIRKNDDEYYLKQEFETTEIYNARMLAFGRKIFSKETTLDSLLSFVVPYMPEAKYDADSSTLKLTSIISKIASDPYTRGVTMIIMPDKYKYYNATNAFGVKVKVRHANSSSVALTASDDIPNEISFKIEANKAKDAKKDGHLLLIGNFEPPYSGFSTNEYTASIDNPYSTTELVVFFHFKTKEIWYFNQKTGEIYNKLALPNDSVALVN